MTQESPDIVGKIRQQASQAWVKLAPVLKTQTLKLLKISISALETLSQKVAPSNGSKLEATDVASEQGDATTAPETAAVTDTEQGKGSGLLQPQIAQLLKWLIPMLQKWHESLEQEQSAPSANLPLATTEPTALPQTATAAIETEAGSPLKPVLSEQVKEEIGVAWRFVQNKLVPAILAFLTKLVETIDPPIDSAWQKISEKVRDTPAITEKWAKVQSSSFWQKSSTAIAPIWRSMGETLGSIKVPDKVKPILEKRAAVTTLVGLFVLLVLLKPSPSHQVAGEPAVSPLSRRPVDEVIAPSEKGSPISPNKIAIADIQSQVSDVSRNYGEALIGSVQTNFRLGRLVVELTDAWYQLSPVKQEQLMADLLERSQALKFKKLLIADASRNLLARSPAVGKEMVILKRSIS